jgi:hypothetical protein
MSILKQKYSFLSKTNVHATGGGGPGADVSAERSHQQGWEGGFVPIGTIHIPN